MSKAIVFIEKGALKEYSIGDNGNERIIQFGLKGLYPILYSFLTEELATYNIDAKEDAELVLISRSA